MVHRIPLAYGDDGLPRKTPHRATFRIGAFAAGLVLWAALEVLWQQAGHRFLDAWSLVRVLAGGLVLGYVGPTLGRTVGVWTINRQVASIRRRVEHRAALAASYGDADGTAGSDAPPPAAAAEPLGMTMAYGGEEE